MLQIISESMIETVRLLVHRTHLKDTSHLELVCKATGKHASDSKQSCIPLKWNG